MHSILMNQRLKHYQKIFDEKEEMIQYFYNEYHLLSHLLFSDAVDLLPFISKSSIDLQYDSFAFYKRDEKHRIDYNLLDGYAENNNEILTTIV